MKVGAKSANVSGGAAALTLKCVATKRCSRLVSLRYKGKSLASTKFAMGKKQSKTVRLKLNKRGLRLLAKAPKARMCSCASTPRTPLATAGGRTRASG